MILVTGANGFIGGHFVKALGARGEEVLGVDWVDRGWIEYWPWNEISLIIHQGAQSSTVLKNPGEYWSNNVDWTINELFSKAVEYGIPVKYASSASVYGRNVNTVINPLNQYALSKLQVDYWVEDYIDQFPLIQGFRYFNVYGPGEEGKGDQASPVSKFGWQAQETGKIRIFEGSARYSRDFIYVGDLVNVVLDNDRGSGIYDLGSCKPTSFKQVADMVAFKYNAEIEVVPFPDHLKGKYQELTCSAESWNKRFISVQEYLNDPRLS